jgi:hypothetical protein
MKVSVLIPTRNRAHTLRQTIEAMQQQTARYDELIVGDDASSDRTAETVAQFSDPRIQYVRHEKNLGIYGNWNDLIARASGDYLCIYHDHDRYLPHILERSRQILDEHPNVAFVHTALLFIDSQDEVADTDIRPFPAVMPGAQMRAMLARGWHSPIMAATVMARREAYRAAGPYRPERYGLGCDKHMWFEMSRAGDAGYVSEPQALIRTRERGTGTAQFDWANEWGMLRMRVEETAAAFAQEPKAYVEAARCLKRETSTRFLTRAVRALLLEPAEAWAREEEKVVSVLGPVERSLYQAIRHSASLRKLAAGVALPLHYRRIARQQESARKKAHKKARSFDYGHV